MADATGASAAGRRPATADAPVLLYDGVCALCNGTVRAVLRLDRRGDVRFAPLDGSFAAEVLARHPSAATVDSLVLVEPSGQGERVLVKSDAVLRLGRHLGGVCRVAAVLRVFPRALRDWVYDFVARRRYRVFGRLDLRPPPPDSVRHRFLE